MPKDVSASSRSASSQPEIDWDALYELLPNVVMRAVYMLRISLWYGQEYDIVNDIIQETLLRLLERLRKAERGEAAPIGKPAHLATVIAFNYCRDMRRHDKRVVHFPASLPEFEDRHLYATRNARDCSEEAIELVFLAALFEQLAREVSAFPTKQRTALLTDLANMMHFGPCLSSLQQAFLAVDIDLRLYQQELDTTFKARSQHTALLYWAYKRMLNLSSIQEYIAC